MSSGEIAELVAQGMELAGMVVIVLGALATSFVYLHRALRSFDFGSGFRAYRSNLGRSILLGLEFLVAADIIDTVAIEPDFRSVGILAGIVLIRTFLSFALDVEIRGVWPWQHADRR